LGGSALDPSLLLLQLGFLDGAAASEEGGDLGVNVGGCVTRDGGGETAGAQPTSSTSMSGHSRRMGPPGFEPGTNGL
jgi:hypothetical protein